MKHDLRDPKAMGEVILSSLDRLRTTGAMPDAKASEAAERLEYLHSTGRVILPDFDA